MDYNYEKKFGIILFVAIAAYSMAIASWGQAPGKVSGQEKAISPWDYVKLLDRGLDVDWSKTEQGRKYYNEKAVEDFKESGLSMFGSA